MKRTKEQSRELVEQFEKLRAQGMNIKLAAQNLKVCADTYYKAKRLLKKEAVASETKPARIHRKRRTKTLPEAFTLQVPETRSGQMMILVGASADVNTALERIVAMTGVRI